MISRGGLKQQKRNKNQSQLVTSCLIGRLYEIWRKETNQTCSSISVYFCSIYIYKAFPSRQLKFTDIHDIKNSIMPSPRLFLFFKISLKVQRRKKMTQRDRGSAATFSFLKTTGIKIYQGNLWQQELASCSFVCLSVKTYQHRTILRRRHTLGDENNCLTVFDFRAKKYF